MTTEWNDQFDDLLLGASMYIFGIVENTAADLMMLL